jgi:site-specific recombinase XerC
MIPIAPHIEAYLRDHLGHQRGASPHTSESYAHSFRRLFEFAATRLKLSPSALTVAEAVAAVNALKARMVQTGAPSDAVELVVVDAAHRVISTTHGEDA